MRQETRKKIKDNRCMRQETRNKIKDKRCMRQETRNKINEIRDEGRHMPAGCVPAGLALHIL